MVVGGGIGGIQAALDLAESGLKVYHVEKSPSIGGTMARLDKTFPTNDCSMCILSPKLVECGRHLNIESMTQTDILDVAGNAGDFKIKLRTRARYVDLEKCTACGECAEACPVQFNDEFNAGLSKRKATYREFPQAFPNAFTIEKREPAPCSIGCPGGINIQGFIALISVGKYNESLALIRESMAFPSVCGRVCHHPCEIVCKRGDYETPLSIMALKRFVSDKCGKDKLHLPEIEKARPQKVAIVGAGPAGLSAAFELAKQGYPVEVFEALPYSGGMLKVGIPDYRLPPDVLQSEIDRISKMGVKITNNTRLGKDFTIASLKKKGFKAVLLSIGAHSAMKMGIDGEELEGVIDCVDFLRNINLGNKIKTGKKVVVVGGGNAAIDSARVAKRLGNPDVTILYRRTRREMPASAEEIEDAIREGIDIQYLAAPVRAIGRNGKIAKLVCKKMELGAPDASGRRRPVPIPNSEYELAVNTLIPSISQKVNIEGAKGISQTRWGSIETLEGTSRTNISAVFACGDAVLGPNTVIDCIAAGKDAASDIHANLSGRKEISSEKPENEPREYEFPDFIEHAERAEIPEIEVNQRINNFNEVCLALSEKDAVSEAKRCLSCGGCSDCMQCVVACEAGAICHTQKDTTTEINVGAIILAPGFKEFDAGKKFSLGYSRSQNIVSSMEYERILSASGPFGGHVVRPSDQGPVKKLAFIQCVGSRDNQCGNGYCSSVCCMYALKEAVITSEHDKSIKPTIFYMDMRTHGKEFDKYYERAKDEYGVLLKRSRVYSVEENAEGQVIITYEDEEGKFNHESFDMAVLSVGLEAGDDFPMLAEKLQIELNSQRFFKTYTFAPLDTSRPGIYACGAASGPKDIPETVVQASGAAARAGMLIGESRGTLTEAKVYPDEIDTSYQGPRIGVFVCRCGTNIAGFLDVPSVAEYAEALPNVVYSNENIYTCSQDTQEKIKELIKEHNLNRIVVASCSPRTHEPLFQETIREAGLNKHLFEMANIRDQCSWVHMDDWNAATEKAFDLVRMAVAKVRDAVALTPVMLDVTHSAMILGGGLAGMTAALAIAEQGFEVTLVEKTHSIGGNLLRVVKDIHGNDIAEYLKDLIKKTKKNKRIKILTDSRIVESAGFLGNYESSIETQKGKKITASRLTHGVTIVAVGGNESKPTEYLYGKNKKVLTQLDLEETFVTSDYDTKKNNAFPKSVVMIQCVGSREPDHMYCSKICCAQAIKNAIRIKKTNNDTDVFILFRDIRTYGFNERYYKQARELGVQFIRYTRDNKPQISAKGKRLTINVHDTLLGVEINIPADLLILSSRIDPNDDAERIAPTFKVPLNSDNFFMEAHAKLRPVDFATEGVFLCGLAHYPKDITETIAQALAAAGRAVTVLARDKIEGEARVASVKESRCSACGACVEVCAYNAITMNEERQVANVNAGLCKGCGACAATCRAAAIDVQGFRDEQILNVLKVMQPND